MTRGKMREKPTAAEGKGDTKEKSQHEKNWTIIGTGPAKVAEMTGELFAKE